jgi:hypothetical protein
MGRNDWVNGPGENAQRALEVAASEVSRLVAKTDDVMNGLWSDWVTAAEALDRSPEQLFEALGTPD